MSEQAHASQGAATTALVAEAASKSGLVWLRPAGAARWWPAWHVWHEGAVLVVSGPGEQELPELDGEVELSLRSKDSGGRLLTVTADASLLDPTSQEWADAAAALASSRLNSAHSPADLPAHWRAVGTRVTRVTPDGHVREEPGRYDDASGAAAPAPTPATTSGWRPWHAGGRERRRLRLRRARRRDAGQPPRT